MVLAVVFPVGLFLAVLFSKTCRLSMANFGDCEYLLLPNLTKFEEATSKSVVGPRDGAEAERWMDW